MTKVLVDEHLLEKVLMAHALVLENLRVWNNEDDLLWIQYARTALLHDISKLRSTIQSPGAESEKVDAQTLTRLDIKPPNESGETLCAVRWMAETKNGWVGSYDRAALEQLRVTDAKPVRTTSERAPVFQYLDGQVAKDMKGFYDAFGIKQPPERN